MELTKQHLLDKTHHGLNIYSFVLQKFYPDQTVIFLSGRKCKPAKNPFKGDTETLLIEAVDNVFLFKDSHDPTFKGDPFDFAARYFKVTEDDLLQVLNQEMHLNIGVNPWRKDSDLDIEVIKHEPQPKIVWPQFSYFQAPVTNTSPLKEVTIVDVYHAIRYEFQDQTATLRNTKDKKAARKHKAKHFDYVTFSGHFTSRSDKDLVKHSGYLAMDFDHVEDLKSLSAQLLSDEYFETEILFTSPSGDGLKWVISIDITEYTHKDWFLSIKNYIRETYQVEVDSAGKDVSRACFLPHDPNIFLHSKYHSS